MGVIVKTFSRHDVDRLFERANRFVVRHVGDVLANKKEEIGSRS